MVEHQTKIRAKYQLGAKMLSIVTCITTLLSTDNYTCINLLITLEAMINLEIAVLYIMCSTSVLLRKSGTKKI